MAEEEELSLELKDLINRAQKQPGIAELMSVYGQANELMQISNRYLEGLKPKSAVWATSNST